MTHPHVTEPVITLSTGPVNAYPAVLRAMARTVHYDYDPYFLAFYERVNEKLRAAFGTATPPVILQGEPVLGLEAAAASMIARQDVVLNLASGVYGKGFGYWAKRHCRELVEIEVPYHNAIDPAAVAAAFDARPEIAVVSLVHHDTPSGTINPLGAIARIVRERGAALIVDAVSSWGGMPIDVEADGGDLFVTGPNKCLGAPPGLTLLHVSERGWAKMTANPDAPRASVLSIVDWRDAWRKERPFPFTPSVAEINGLDAALDEYLAEGPEHVWARHALTARACRAGVKALGLRLWAEPEAIAAPTTTAVAVPAGLEDAAIRQAARDLYGVTFSSGRGATLGKVIRIGHMGATAQPVYAVVAVTALGGALRRLGHDAPVGAAVEAALAVIGG